MMHVSECREFAKECRAMAKAVRNRAQKAQLLRLAEQWDALARARQLAEKPKRKPLGIRWKN